MPAMDKINYNYDGIDQAVQAMSKSVDKMKEMTSELAQHTKQLMGDAWSGSAAQEYDTKSNEIQKLLDQQGQQLASLHGKVGSGGSQMQETDRNGSKQFAK